MSDKLEKLDEITLRKYVLSSDASAETVIQATLLAYLNRAITRINELEARYDLYINEMEKHTHDAGNQETTLPRFVRTTPPIPGGDE
jgi:hypothetical protein